MPNITSKSLSKIDATKMIVDCNIAGQYKDKFLLLKDVDKKAFTDLPRSAQQDIEIYISNGSADILIRKKT